MATPQEPDGPAPPPRGASSLAGRGRIGWSGSLLLIALAMLLGGLAFAAWGDPPAGPQSDGVRDDDVAMAVPGEAIEDEATREPVSEPPAAEPTPTPTPTPTPVRSPSAGDRATAESDGPDPEATATADPDGTASPDPEDADEADEEDEDVAVSSASGDLSVVGGGGALAGDSDQVMRYRVAVEDDLPNDPEAFAEDVEDILADDRGWIHEGEWAFERVDDDEDDEPDFTIVLAAPDTVDELCYPLDTHGDVSCFNGEQAVINQNRWVEAVPHYEDELEAYRQYVINHEVGHALGFGHVECPGEGEPAPVMQQQTYSLDECEQNPWPFP